MEKVKVEQHSLENAQPSKKKKSRVLYWLIVIVGAIFIFVASYNIGFKLGSLVEDGGSTTTKEDSNSNSNETSNVESNSNENNQNKELSQDTLKKLLNIIGLNSVNETNDLVNENGVLLYVNGVVSSIDSDNITMLVYWNALRNNLVTEVDGSEYSLCYDGSGSCRAIEIDDFKLIAKKYGITVDPTTLFPKEQIYNNKVLYTLGGFANEYTINHNVTANYSGNDIVLTDNISKVHVDTKQETKLVVTYTFKLDAENNYYLYSVYTK